MPYFIRRKDRNQLFFIFMSFLSGLKDKKFPVHDTKTEPDRFRKGSVFFYVTFLSYQILGW